MFRPRYVSFFLCVLGHRRQDGICIRGPRNWTFFGTPFVSLRFTVRAQVCQGPGLSGPRSDRICAEDLGAAVCLTLLWTEAPDHQQTADI